MRFSILRILLLLISFCLISAQSTFSQEYVELVACKWNGQTCAPSAPEVLSLPELSMTLAGALVGIRLEESVKASVKMELIIPGLAPFPLEFELVSSEGSRDEIYVLNEDLSTFKLEYPILELMWERALLLVTLRTSEGELYFGADTINEGSDGIQTGNAANPQGRPGSGEEDGPSSSSGGDSQVRPKFIPSGDSQDGGNALASGSSCGVQAEKTSSLWILMLLVLSLVGGLRFLTRIRF